LVGHTVSATHHSDVKQQEEPIIHKIDRNTDLASIGSIQLPIDSPNKPKVPIKNTSDGLAYTSKSKEDSKIWVGHTVSGTHRSEVNQQKEHINHKIDRDTDRAFFH
jgi:hypothetical protein